MNRAVDKIEGFMAAADFSPVILELAGDKEGQARNLFIVEDLPLGGRLETVDKGFGQSSFHRPAIQKYTLIVT
jgi:hypothetical protein